MAITKDQKSFIFLSICTICLMVILGLCLNIVFQNHAQSMINTEKTIQLQTLHKTLSTMTEDNTPSNNPLTYLKDCGGENIIKITQDKYLTCELNCSYKQLLLFLQKYAKAPAYIQSLQILRDKALLVTMHCDTLGELKL